MRLFIVEDKIGTIMAFIQAVKDRHWTYTDVSVGAGTAATEQAFRDFLKNVCEYKPDIVLVDTALTDDEEVRLDQLIRSQQEVSEGEFTGLRYCQALAREKTGIPIVLFTKYFNGQVARAAIKAGADHVLSKSDPTDMVLREIEELVKSRTPHDAPFYWAMCDAFTRRPNMWQADPLQKALRRFFLNTTSVRRFSLFASSLREILSALFSDEEAERTLMLGLVKGQVLLSMVDPRLRDHVKHTGNVFWMGYRMLHEMSEFEDPLALTGCIPALYPSGPLTPREQLLYAWTLAALFHDYGYADEKQKQLTDLIGAVLSRTTFEVADVRTSQWAVNMRNIRDFVSSLLGPGHFLVKFVETATTSVGIEEVRKGKNGKSPMLDHGVLSAHRLLNLISLERLDCQKKQVVLHAALAMIFHNHQELVERWACFAGCGGNLPVGLFPVCSLLTVCDNIQTWDREPDMDPAIADPGEGLLEKLVLSDNAYVSGSEIREFSISPATNGYTIHVKLRYFIEGTRRADEVCESLGADIQKWIQSERLRRVCDASGFSSLLHGTVVYELPMLSGTKRVDF